jgi:xanthine dehydrogenase small subunit
MGGNLANASPIGDSLPGLLALDARITLRKGEHQRTVNATEFFVDYRHTILGESEFIENISFAKLLPQQVFKMYKVSKRIEEDISAVVGAFCIGIKNSTVVHVRLAFGGMAEIPKRALLCEQALLQKPWNIETIDAACSALLNDFEPISDVRASARYRLLVAQNLLKKYFFESQSAQPIGVVDYA